MTGQIKTQSVRDRGDRRLQHGVAEGRDLAGLLVDRVVMVLMGIGVGDLEPRDTVTTVHAVEEPQFVEIVQHAVHGGSGSDVDRVDHVLRAHQAPTVSGEHLHDGTPRLTGPKSGASYAAPCFLEPFVGACPDH